MSQAEGVPLHKYCEQRAKSMAMGEAAQVGVALLRQQGEALALISRLFLHRDVNMRNIVIHAERQEFVLVDFGCAVPAGEWAEHWAATDPAGDTRYWCPV